MFYQEFTVAMTSANTPAPNVVAATSSDATEAAWKLFDQTSVCWQSSIGCPAWVSLYIGGFSKVLKKYTITAHNNWASYPVGFKIQGSNDSSNWVDIDSQTGQSWTSGETKTYYTTANTAGYLYHRLYVTNTSNGTSEHPEVDELHMWTELLPFTAGDAVHFGPTSLADAAFLDMKPLGINDAAADNECVIHNLACNGAAELYLSDGTNNVLVDTYTVATGWALGQSKALHCTNSKYYRLKNINGNAQYFAADGVVTK